MAKVLIIWEEIPEETKFFIEDFQNEELEKVLKAHGQLVNESGKFPEAEWLSEILVNKDPIFSSEMRKGMNAIDLKGIVGLDFIVWSGFML